MEGEQVAAFRYSKCDFSRFVFCNIFRPDHSEYKDLHNVSDSAVRNATMFLPENPLLQSVSDRKAAFEACADAINIALRRVEFSFNGNPAIECFDTLCGNGGKIDVNRTIAFFPTSLVWKYRGAHKVSCAFAELTDEATVSVSEVATFAAAVANKSPLSTKNKTDKRIDDVAKRANGIGDPIILTENSAKYLDYNYDVVGYYAGDTATYGISGNDIIVQGYVLSPNGKPIADSAKYSSYTFVNTSVFKTVTIYPVVLYRTSEQKDTDGNLYTLYYVHHEGYGEKIDGTSWESSGNTLTTRNTDWGGAYQYTGIYAPDDSYPYGSVDIYTKAYLTNEDGTYQTLTTPSVGRVPFASIAEYNAAVKLTRSPIEKKDVIQAVSKIIEAGGTADFPKLGETDVLYIDSTDNSAYKWSSKINAYYCVGRDYFSIKQIQSAAEPNSSEAEILEAQLLQDMRSPTEWTLHSSFVPPKGYMCITDFESGQHGIKIGDGNTPWSELLYVNIYDIDLSGYLKSDEIADWAKADEKPSYTAGEVGAAAKKHTHTKSEITDFPTLGTAAVKNTDYFAAAGHTHTAADVGAATAADITAAVNAVSIGGRNIITGTAEAVIGYGGHSKGHWRKYGTAGTIQTVDITNTPISCVSKGIRLTSTDENSQIICGQDDIPLNSGVIYTFSCRIRSNSAEGVPCRLQPFYKSTTDHSGNTQDIIISDEWQYISFTAKFSPQSTGTYSGARIYLQPTAAGNYIEVCAMKLEAGNKPTDWSPASEDAERRITSLEARVAALEAAAVSGGEV